MTSVISLSHQLEKEPHFDDILQAENVLFEKKKIELVSMLMGMLIRNTIIN
jgi:hypothetical protein